MANENKNEVVEVKTEQKVGLVGKAKQKASGLVNYTDKDIQKLEKEAEKAYNEFYVLDLAVRLLKNPQDEEILKEVAGLDDKTGKALKAILNRKKIRLAAIGGTLVVIGVVAAVSTAKAKKSSSVVDVDSEEIDDDDYEEDEDDDDVEEDESVEETDEAPVEE